MASRDPDRLHPYLRRVWMRASREWNQAHELQVFLTATYRPNVEQTALYAQGRQSVDIVNKLRLQAGLARITATENKRKVTWVKAGGSVHNYDPAGAFDVAFKEPDGTLSYDADALEEFAALVCQDPLVQWGIDRERTTETKDRPHFQFLGLTAQHLRQGQDPVEVAQFFHQRNHD